MSFETTLSCPLVQQPGLVGGGPPHGDGSDQGGDKGERR